MADHQRELPNTNPLLKLVERTSLLKHLTNSGTPEAWGMMSTKWRKRCVTGCEEWKGNSIVNSPIATKGPGLEAAIDVPTALVLGSNDHGNEQEIVGRTPFAPHILCVRFSKSFMKPTDMGYDVSTDQEDHIDAFEGRMN
ncbi:hypothetical protein PIB30_046854 [Stylosanthes scabra]|uniref:Uncharacterized protein n=1 Tax=Stylosanthes scabra TaxID=79078 RepID=A0ABU6ZFA6_9FABA|nr:hypothetical protein [Stylosanthes scabra]